MTWKQHFWLWLFKLWVNLLHGLLLKTNFDLLAKVLSFFKINCLIIIDEFYDFYINIFKQMFLNNFSKNMIKKIKMSSQFMIYFSIHY